MVSRKLTVVSLFSGAGGFDHGFCQAGFETILASELLEAGSNTIASNFNLEIIKTPHSPEYNEKKVIIQGDIRDVEFSKYHYCPDVVIGGPPCQDFSRIRGGTQEGLNGGRGKLYAEFIRALMFLQPKFFVFENVPGLVSANDGKAYQTIQEDFQNFTKIQEKEIEKGIREIPQEGICSYHLLYNSIVFTSNIGVPQNRKRLIIIGIRQDLIEELGEEEIAILKERFSNSLEGKGKLFRKFPLTILEVFSGKPLHKLDDHYKRIMLEYKDIAESDEIPNKDNWLNQKWNKLSLNVIEDYYQACGLDYSKEFNEDEFLEAMEAHRGILEQLDWLNEPLNSLDETRNTRTSSKVQERMFRIPPGENYSFVDNTEWEVAGHNISLIYRRAEPLKPAWTVVAYGGGGTYGYHYERDRAQLSLREKARIQTFPDDVKFFGKKSEIRAQIGEAVPPLLGKIIAKEIKSILDDRKDLLSTP